MWMSPVIPYTPHCNLALTNACLYNGITINLNKTDVFWIKAIYDNRSKNIITASFKKYNNMIFFLLYQMKII